MKTYPMNRNFYSEKSINAFWMDGHFYDKDSGMMIDHLCAESMIVDCYPAKARFETWIDENGERNWKCLKSNI